MTHDLHSALIMESNGQKGQSVIEGLSDGLGVHRAMVVEAVRNEAFRIALEAAARPGDVMLDIGADTGILSLFTARAGAGRVYAVEPSSDAAPRR